MQQCSHDPKNTVTWKWSERDRRRPEEQIIETSIISLSKQLMSHVYNISNKTRYGHAYFHPSLIFNFRAFFFIFFLGLSLEFLFSYFLSMAYRDRLQFHNSRALPLPNTLLIPSSCWYLWSYIHQLRLLCHRASGPTCYFFSVHRSPTPEYQLIYKTKILPFPTYICVKQQTSKFHHL